MPRQCTVCAHEDRAEVDEALVRGVPYRDIVKRHGGVSISSLSRHRQDHVSPALATVVAEKGPRTALDRLEELYLDAKSILAAAKADGKAALSLTAVRELRGIVESLAKITGELDERPQVNVVNLQTSPEWLTLRSAIMQALVHHPEARMAVAGRIATLESGREPA